MQSLTLILIAISEDDVTLLTREHIPERAANPLIRKPKHFPDGRRFVLYCPGMSYQQRSYLLDSVR